MESYGITPFIKKTIKQAKVGKRTTLDSPVLDTFPSLEAAYGPYYPYSTECMKYFLGLLSSASFLLDAEEVSRGWSDDGVPSSSTMQQFVISFGEKNIAMAWLLRC